MNSDWTAVIGISLAVMAVVQVVLFGAIAFGLVKMYASVKQLEQRVDTAVDEFRPQLVAILADAKSASTNAQDLMREVRDRLAAVDETARSLKARANRIVDGVQWAASALPLPVKVSGPAAMAAWAGVRAAASLLDRARARRNRRRSEALLQEAGGHVGIG